MQKDYDNAVSKVFENMRLFASFELLRKTRHLPKKVGFSSGTSVHDEHVYCKIRSEISHMINSAAVGTTQHCA